MSLPDGSRWTARELRARARATGLQTTLRYVYLTLDSYANGAPECFASHATLCEDTGLGRTALKDALRDLEAQGWIARTRGGGVKGNGGTTTLYTIADAVCKSDNNGRPPDGPAARRPRGFGLIEQPLAVQLREEPKEQTSGSPRGRAASRPTYDARSARREARPDPKPPKKVSGRLTRQPDGTVVNARAKASDPEVEVVADQRVLHRAAAVPQFSDAQGGERKTAAERNQERNEAIRARARRVAEEAIRRRRGQELP